MAYYGYIASFVAVIFFGSNYVPMKYHDTGDGMTFQWIMCSGILAVGYISLSWAKTFVFNWTGLIGGGLWALGGAMVIPIIKFAGLGVGFLVWSSANLIGAYFWGRLGLFGLKKEHVDNEVFSIGGIIIAIIALVVFFFIDGPDDKKVEVLEEYSPEDAEASTMALTHSAGSIGKVYNSINTNIDSLDSSDSENPPAVVIDSIDLPDKNGVMPETAEAKGKISQFVTRVADKLPFGKRIVGLIMALTAGLLYSVSLVPFQVWKDNHKHTGPVDFVFSQFSGIYITSTALFLVYSLVVRPPRFYPKATLSSFVCGAMWGVATSAQLIGIADLGLVVGYPIIAIGPILVTSAWSLIWFREIRGWKNLVLFLLSDLLILVAIACLVLSKIKQVAL